MKAIHEENRMHTKLFFTLLLATLLLGPRSVNGQDRSDSATTKQKTEQPKPATAYRLDLSLIELEDGKKLNTRQHVLNIAPGVWETNTLKIGTRVPIELKQGEMQYIDVGTSIFASMREVNEVLQLEARAELSNLADPAQQSRTMPLLRQLQINGSTVVVIGKPMLIGAVDDPNSKRQFQLEVLVTKLR
jgi:hypothetical protein